MQSETAPIVRESDPARRLDDAEIHRQAQMILDNGLLSRLCEAMMNAVAIVNQHRQIVYCNQSFAALGGSETPEKILGKRPGEVLECVHSNETPDGCGTAEPCAVCGAVHAVLEAQKGVVTNKEANIRRSGGRADANLELKATPIHHGGELFVIIAVTDISDRTRRRALERIFFHDLMNTASGLKIISEGLPDLMQPQQSRKIKNQILNGVAQLMEQIKEQRGLLAAENDELKPTIRPVRSLQLLSEVADYYEHFEISKNREIIIANKAVDAALETDRSLVFRVIGNMVKNALEACSEGEAVTLSCKKQNGGIEFQVHNPEFIPRKIQFQLFQRSFSTKAEGRGLGTYSMKLLTEHYLGGRVSFASSETAGTTFHAWYPLRIKNLP